MWNVDKANLINTIYNNNNNNNTNIKIFMYFHFSVGFYQDSILDPRGL